MRGWRIVLLTGIALLAGIGGLLVVLDARSTFPVPSEPPPDPSAWLAALDELLLVPAELSVTGTVFLATLFVGLAVMRRAGIKPDVGSR